MTQDNEMYTDVATVARAYGVTTATVRAWCANGTLEGAKHAGRQWRIPKRYATGTLEIKLPAGGDEKKA